MKLGTRSAGLLLHLTALPGPSGSGDLGPPAHRFAELLERAGCRWWQTLPVTPPGAGFSPYSGSSAFAGNPLLISLEALVSDGLLLPGEIREFPSGPAIDMETIAAYRTERLRAAIDRFVAGGGETDAAYVEFGQRERDWLDDYARFRALGARHGADWTAWPDGLRARDPDTLARADDEERAEILRARVEQFFFDRQWRALRATCLARGVGLIGDAPIFVSHQSADVWANQDMFRLDATGAPTHVAGVPPDYFSKTGQRWGNPLYRWRFCEKTKFRWWVARFARLTRLFDVVRLDHFIGFVRYWAVPAAEETAVNGKYMKAPGAGLFETVREQLGDLPLIAEDLGAVTPAVKRLRRQLGVPGMKVFQFAFGTDVQAKDFLPHAYPRNTVAYSGTHDNDTLVGWLDDRGGGPRSPEQAATEHAAALAYVGASNEDTPKEVTWKVIRTLYASVASTVILPVQDVLTLDNGARMNVPGSAEGNWRWRLGEKQLTPEIVERLRGFADIYGRR